MSFYGDTLAAALPEMRAFAEERMTSTCTVSRPGETTTDANGDVTTPLTPVYAGPCRARRASASERVSEAGGASITTAPLVVSLPFPTSSLGQWQVDPARSLPGDVVTFTADLDTPEQVGLTVRVVSVESQSQATAVRLRCEEIQGDGV